jgi:hypothetical protein
VSFRALWVRNFALRYVGQMTAPYLLGKLAHEMPGYRRTGRDAGDEQLDRGIYHLKLATVCSQRCMRLRGPELSALSLQAFLQGGLSGLQSRRQDE